MPVHSPEDAHRLFREYFNSANLEGLAALYEADAVLVTGPGEVAKGLSAIREALQRFLATKAQMEIQTHSITQCGELALLRGDWHMVVEGKEIARASSTEVVRRQPDGRWLYVIDNPYGAS